MEEYWNKEWSNNKIDEYIKYIRPDFTPRFFEIFSKYNIKNVCDAACGFGTYSIMLNNRGFEVSGFDIAENSVNLTKNMLKHFKLPNDDYKTCSITDISFKDEAFDAVVAHAVIDHLSKKSACTALNELYRITKQGGLIYLSFDCLEEDDLNLAHEILEDGSFLYTDKSRDGLLFNHYTNEDIEKLLLGKQQIYFNTTKRGDREVILKK
ncbi:class I SAM-dependent methyltransferase [Sedimentibacter sp. zth1]|uniref:class I SAM-dependent methyltransferase n=1 Tax=Sedimentibacter sp. zth1 TaxID=2816908 RepID=UPI001A93A18B|nr:class I SAM-dependent methyltransferase [Sedimentibacter sp. zth1]QSX06571.1 class I SAM-dependent methyltransferase [Sedimentibacter sp. zth1]